MISFVMEVSGFRELQNQLSELKKATAQKIVKKAVKAGGNVVKKAAQRNARSMVGGEMGNRIAKAIEVKPYRNQRAGSFAMFCAVGSDDAFVHKNWEGTREWIPNAIEFGHALPYEGGSGKKDVQPIPFMRTAVDSEKSNAEEAMNKELINGIETEFYKQGR